MSSTPPSGDYQDRSTVLRVIGVLTILGAVGLVALSGLAPVGISSNGVRAGLLVALGVGSIRARRWAPVLWLALAPIWFIGTADGLPEFIFQLTHLRPTADLPTPAPARILLAESVSLALLILPAVLFLFFRSRDVRRTCEQRDPRPRWTDNCPWPVLTLSLDLLLKGWSWVRMAWAHPAPSLLLTNVLGAALAVLLAWGIYRRLAAAWIAALVLMVGAVGGVVGSWHTSSFSLALTGQASLPALLERGTLLAPPIFWLGWLIWVRRYFGFSRTQSAGPVAAT